MMKSLMRAYEKAMVPVAAIANESDGQAAGGSSAEAGDAGGRLTLADLRAARVKLVAHTKVLKHSIRLRMHTKLITDALASTRAAHEKSKAAQTSAADGPA